MSLHTFVKVRVKPDKKSRFHEFLKRDGEYSRNHEPGTLRLEIFEDVDDPNIMYIYHSYRDQNAIDEHRSNPPYSLEHGKVVEECLESAERLMGFSEPWWSMEV